MFTALASLGLVALAAASGVMTVKTLAELDGSDKSADRPADAPAATAH